MDLGEKAIKYMHLYPLLQADYSHSLDLINLPGKTGGLTLSQPQLPSFFSHERVQTYRIFTSNNFYFIFGQQSIGKEYDFDTNR